MADFFKTVKMILEDPTKFFNSVKKEDIEPAFKYLLVLALIPIVIIMIIITVVATLIATLGSLFSMYGMDIAAPYLLIFSALGPLIGIGIGIVFYIIVLVCSFISAAILHVFAWIIGAKKGYGNTYKAYVYGMTPELLFVWLPIINILFGLWSWFLLVKGLSVLHGITMGRAFLATLIPIIIVLAIISSIIGTAIMYGTLTGIQS